jgi:hypothetical protein
MFADVQTVTPTHVVLRSEMNYYEYVSVAAPVAAYHYGSHYKEID